MASDTILVARASASAERHELQPVKTPTDVRLPLSGFALFFTFGFEDFRLTDPFRFEV